MKKSLKIATLNARTINKTTNRTGTRNFHKFLATQRIDVLALQETSIDPTDTSLVQHLDTSLQAHQSIWTSHCALLLIHPKLTILSSYVLLDERAIVASIGSLDTGDSTLFEICAIYAPSGAICPRNTFFNNLLELPFFQSPGDDIIVMGDLNYHHHKRNSAPAAWKGWLNQHTINTLNAYNSLPIHTFNNRHTQTTIDYIFMSPSLAERITAPSHTYLHSDWTDHSMLSCNLSLEALETGPGVWRLNVSLLRDAQLQAQLTEIVQRDLQDLERLPPRVAWDQMKLSLQEALQRAGIQRAKDKQQLSQRLQKERQHLLRRIKWQEGAPNPNTAYILDLKKQWHEIEKRLDGLLEESMTGWALRTQMKWREFGERCSKYFFRVLKARATKRTITHLKVPNSSDIAHTPHGLCSVGKAFYQKLYTPDPIDQDAIDLLLSHVPQAASISEDDQENLVRSITPEDIMLSLERSAREKAPGMDGFPFELYGFLLTINGVASLLARVMTEALTDARMPQSWLQTCMILLYKKGDASDLANWRPLSLINSDAKLFTKIITLRLHAPLDDLITPFQTGFVPGRKISDNGLVMAAFREHCERYKIDGVGILFDQEKAYDRVHPVYLRAVMERMRFPAALINSVFTLFFSTHINLNINGYLTQPFAQQRGLRQGDPLSPLLYNIAIEPLLRTILACPEISGIKLCDHARTEPLKLMAYADDLWTVIRTADEWTFLKGIMDTFGRASNARLNLKKTVAFPLFKSVGALSQALQQDHVHIHSKRAEGALVYLGFPLALNKTQRDSFFDNIYTKIKHHINATHGRQLSVMGRGLIANSLLLSRLWHVISVQPPTRSWTRKVQGSIRKFTLPFFPAPSWNFICLRRSQGGLGLVDIGSQAVAFQLRAVQRICSDSTSFMVSFFKDMICTATSSDYPLAPFVNPDFYLTPGKKYFRPHSILRGLVQAIKTIPPVSWTQAEAEAAPVGTMLATLLPQWLHADGVPAPHPPLWRSDHVLRPFWTNEEQTEGYLEFIPAADRSAGHRHRRALEDNIRNQHFNPHPVLQRALDNSGPLSLEDDLADHINAIVVDDSKKGTFGLASTRIFRRAAFDKIYQPTAPHHHPMAPARPQFTARFWTGFWRTIMPHNARNVWWRLLINKLPSGDRLHAIIPDVVEPICRICNNAIETDSHLLFSCPKKLEVWQGALTTYIKDHTWTADQIERLFFPRPETLTPLNNVPLALLLGSILATIWRFHFAFVREDQSFETGTVSAAVDITVTQVLAQLEERRKREERRQPPAAATQPETDTNFPT